MDIPSSRHDAASPSERDAVQYRLLETDHGVLPTTVQVSPQTLDQNPIQNSDHKRSRQLNRSQWRKHFTPRPLALGIAGILLSACGDDREQGIVFQNVADCVNHMPDHQLQCETAYQQALAEAARTAPKYDNREACEHEFGYQQCSYDQGSGWFMPLMAGYMVGSMTRPSYRSAPLFTSYSRYSPYRNQWLGSDGVVYGANYKRSFKVKSRAFEPKPTVARTIQRGGFGSSVRAKSSWGSSRGGWGG